MALVFELLRYLAAAALGVYLGAMLTEGFVLVPYWRSLAPEDFLRWYAANDQRLVGFFGPVTSAGTLLAVAAAAVSLWEGHPGRWAALGAATIMVALVAGFLVYFEPANASFAKSTIAVADVPEALARWQRWHCVRTVLSAVAFVAALAAIWQAPRGSVMAEPRITGATRILTLIADPVVQARSPAMVTDMLRAQMDLMLDYMGVVE